MFISRKNREILPRPAHRPRTSTGGQSKLDLQRLVHELEVQQEEGRLQNVQLTESQALLEESRDRYAKLYDFAPVAFITLCDAGVIREINLTGAALLGRARGNLIDRPFIHFVDPADRRVVFDHMGRCRAQGRALSVEFMLRDAHNHTFPVQLASNPAIIEGGRVCIRSAIIDLAEQKKAEAERERLRASEASEQRLRAIVSALPVGVRVLDRHGNVTLNNEMSRRIWGRSDLPLDRWGDFPARRVNGGTRLARNEWPAARAIQRGETVINELIELEKTPGERRFLQLSAVPLRDNDGTILGAVSVTEDVTAQIEGEGRLRDAKDAAEQASRVKDEFLAIASHELRTPISAVLLWAHLLKGCLEDPKGRDEAMGMIEHSARAQATLVNDLLDVSRMVVGKMRLNLQPQDLRSVLMSSADSVRPTAQARGIRLTVDVGDRAVTAAIDTDRLQQVFWNLLNNAIKFTPERGHIEASVSIEGSHALVRVRDSGIGISPRFLPQVFERFRQADSTFTRKHGGLGLGLSIARQLIEMHGGTIRAESPGLGQGATFTVELPLSSAPREASPATIPSEQHPANGAADSSHPDQPLHGLRVLLVEDEHATRTALTRLLRRAGAVVVPVPSAAAARAAYRASPPDILLSDISMPGEDGCALLRRLRAMDRKRSRKKIVWREFKGMQSEKRSSSDAGISHPDFPAVALTAQARPKDIDDTRRAGFQAHLSKPVEPERLITLLAELAAGHIVHRSVAS